MNILRGNPRPMGMGVFNKGLSLPLSCGMILMHVSCRLSKYTQRTRTPWAMKLTYLLGLTYFGFSSHFSHFLICASRDHYLKSLPWVSICFGGNQNKAISQYLFFPTSYRIETLSFCRSIAFHNKDYISLSSL